MLRMKRGAISQARRRCISASAYHTVYFCRTALARAKALLTAARASAHHLPASILQRQRLCRTPNPEVCQGDGAGLCACAR
ncbi:hypothetical protein KCP73_14285 [Salmonella enterica subsp. enterica]|nr:hypothetical protein KCP73_14285 [Salmonella enterica subsp. enterica]